MRVSSDLTALSLFSGAGGLDLGLEAVGWRIVAQVDSDADCIETLNRQAAHRGNGRLILSAAIEAIEPGVLRRRLGLRRGELQLLAGGPPCQPFTTTGLRQGINDRRASSAFPQYFQYVREFMPQVLLMENVDGMLSTALRHRPLAQRGAGYPLLRWEERKGSFLHWLVSELVGFEYAVSWGVVEAADYGVPQLRQRAVVLAVRARVPCFLPARTHGGPRQPPYRTLRDALEGLRETGPIQPLSERKRSTFALIPPGGNWRNLPATMRKATMGAAYKAEGGKGGWWRRLTWNEPAPTILGMPDHSSTGLIHPDDVRCLSVNECALLQSFPRWVRFGGRPRSQYRQIGNAVPPLLAQQLGRKVIRFLNGEREGPPPPPEWRQRSANRRIGVHGWTAVEGEGRPRVDARVREDHVWADRQLALEFG